MKSRIKRSKFAVTEGMSVAIRITQEFCSAMGILRNAAYNFKLTNCGNDFTDVRVELINLPKPNHLDFTLHRCLTGWKIMEGSGILLNLPELPGEDWCPKGLKKGNNTFRVLLATRSENNALTFEKTKTPIS
jgi:hypothetical protein